MSDLDLNLKKRIVLTGGPGGGKTTALDLFRREFAGKVAAVPEAATMLFSGGIERPNDPAVINTQQIAIFNLQKNLEDIQRKIHPHSLIICDRGSLDGLAYWHGDEASFFTTMQSSLEAELARYDAVVFFETSANSGAQIKSNNPIRNESEQQAIALDQRLQAIWRKHPNFNLVKSNNSFLKKVNFGIMTIENIISGISS